MMSDEYIVDYERNPDPDRPTKSGWYYLSEEPKDRPFIAWVHVTPTIFSWGWDSHDDPEMIENGAVLRLI